MGNLLPSFGRRKLPLLEMPKVGGGGPSTVAGAPGAITYKGAPSDANDVLCDGAVLDLSGKAGFPLQLLAQIGATAALATPSGSYIMFSAYGAGTYVVVCNNNTVWYATSDDLTWVQATGYPAKTFSGLEYVNGRFLLLGEGVVCVSTTGQAFTTALTDVGYSWNCAAYGNGLYVFGTIGGMVQTSSDLVTGTITNLTNSNSFTSLTFFNGYFVGAGKNPGNGYGTAFASINGTSWTAVLTITNPANLWVDSDDDVVVVASTNRVTISQSALFTKSRSVDLTGILNPPGSPSAFRKSKGVWTFCNSGSNAYLTQSYDLDNWQSLDLSSNATFFIAGLPPKDGGSKIVVPGFGNSRSGYQMPGILKFFKTPYIPKIRTKAGTVVAAYLRTGP